MSTQDIQSRFISSFPKQFLLKFSQRQKAVYEQSIAISFNDQSWTKTEAFDLLAHNRRALWENELRHLAEECDLKWFDLPHDGDNCSYVLVKAEGLLLTEHFVDGPNQVVRPAKSRKQNAGVNAWMNTYTDDRLFVRPIPRVDSHPIYLHLLHGAQFPNRLSKKLLIDETTCFLRIAIPDSNAERYRFNWSAQELLQKYSAAEEGPKVTVVIKDQAVPRKKTS